MFKSLDFRAALISLLILFALLASWHFATLAPATAPVQATTAQEDEYAKLLGKSTAGETKITGFPTVAQVVQAAEVITRVATVTSL